MCEPRGQGRNGLGLFHIKRLSEPVKTNPASLPSRRKSCSFFNPSHPAVGCPVGEFLPSSLNSIYTSATAWGALGTPSSREGVKVAGFVSFPALRSTSPSHIWLLWPQILPLDVITAAQPVGLDSPRFSFPLPTAFPLAGPSPEQCHRGDCVTPGRAGSVYN